MKAIPRYPHPARLLVLCLACLAAACTEPPRRSGIVDSLNSVSFEPGPATGPTAMAPATAAAVDGGNGAALPRAEIYGGSPRRAIGAGTRRAAARSGDDGVTLNFDRADISEAARVILGDVLGYSYTVDPQVSGEVTLSSTSGIAEEDLLGVFEAILRSNGATLVEVGGGTFQIVPIENAPVQGEVAPLGGDPPDLRPGFGLTVVPLRNINASAAAQFIQPLVSTPEDIRIDSARNLLLFAGTAPERQSVVSVLADLDVNWLADKAVGIFPLRVTTPEAVIGELQAIFGSLDPSTGEIPLVRFMPVARLNAVLAVGTSPGQIEEVERWVARLDRGQTVGTQFYVYNLKHAPAEDVAKLLNEIYSEGPGAGLGEGGLGPAPTGPAALSPFSPDEEGLPEEGEVQDDTLGEPGLAPASMTAAGAPSGVKVVPSRANNSLLIRASPQVYETMEATLLRLDTAPLQVLIEATIVEVLLTDALRYGVQYFIETSGLRFGFNTGSPETATGDFGLEPLPTLPGFNFVFTGGSSNITIDALSRLTDVKVLSSPSLVVQDNREATLTVGDEVPITTRQAVSVEDVDAPVVNSIEYRNTGVILQVRPRINVNGVVSLEIAQEVSRVSDTSVGAIGTLTPTITQRKITSRVNVQSGQTVVLGGLIEDAETRSRDRVPVLGEIPVIGGLFGSTNTSDRRTELIVFITPRVIRNAEEARDVSEELRQRLRSLRPYAPEAALPPVPQPQAPVAPAGPRPVVPPGTLGAAPPPDPIPSLDPVPPEVARSAIEQGVPEEWLPELVGTGPPASPPPPEEPEPLPGDVEASAPAEPLPEMQGGLAEAEVGASPPAGREPEVPPPPPVASPPPVLAALVRDGALLPGDARESFDLARAPVPQQRPFDHLPDPPAPRPVLMAEGD